ncbi:hypothetical protein ACFLYU_00945 [Candidatus Dependentiae bacterium]
MRKITKLLFSILLLSAFVILHADNCCCNNSCCSTSCSSSCNNSCGNNCCGCSSKSCCHCECRVQAHSTFVVRPQYQVGSPEYLTAFRDRMNARGGDCAKGGGLQLTLFGGRSTKAGKLASYFTPDCKTCLLTRGEEPRDIDEQHFNIRLADENALFESKIQFCPRISTMGLGITYRQNLSKLKDDFDPDKKHWWFEISTPLTRVETTMGLSECLTYTGGREPGTIEGLDQKFYSNMKCAFNQSAWCYGKINGCCKCTKTRLADISLMIGYETFKCDTCILDGYFGLLIPTGNERCGKYVFEPMVGHDNHWGIIKGFHLKGTLWENEENSRIIEVAHDSQGAYLFKKDEIRSFDLKCKPWSRYMEVYKNEAQAQTAADLTETNLTAAQFLSSPGINTFTKCLCVRPGLSLASNVAMIYSGCRFRGEIGYNMYWRQSECVELCCWKEGPALKATEGGGNTNPLRTISQDKSIIEVNIPLTTVCDPECYDQGVNITEPIEKYENSIIKACDIDLESATHPGFVSNTLYLSAGGHWDDRDYPLFFDVGGSYEFGCENVVLNRWTAWIKGGVSF